MTTQQITLNIAGAVVTLPEATLSKLWLDKIRMGEQMPCTLELTAAPRIGHSWDGQGGVYAGLARGRDLGVDYHLLLAEPEQESIGWQPALDWAKGLSIDAHADFLLPNRSEQALLFANLKDLFKPEVYWSSEQYAGSESYAWYQYFRYGYQYYDRKTAELRARAVRRVPLL